jgi:hypothetical protein
VRDPEAWLHGKRAIKLVLVLGIASCHGQNSPRVRVDG